MAGTSEARAVAAAIIGNTLEWFDFTVFGLFSVTIANVFFPPETGLKDSLLWTLATFGVGFLTRPLGAVLIGHYADRAGRRAALTLVIGLMTIGTALIALTPGYAEIGVAAPILLVAARLIQGFSVGGELGGATAFLIEAAPPERRGLYASWQHAGQSGAILIGASAGTLVTNLLTAEQLSAWGWRLPFLLGLCVAPVGLYLRRQMGDIPDAAIAEHDHTAPVRQLAEQYRGGLLTTMGSMVLGTACVYILSINMPTYASHELGMTLPNAMIATTISSVIGISVALSAGHLADRIGSRPIMLTCAIVILLAIYPAFRLLIAFPLPAVLIGLQAVLTIFTAGLSGSAYLLMGEQFPASVRSSGLAIGYTAAVVLFGGFASFIATWLIRVTGDKAAPAFYIIGAALVTVAIVARPAAAKRIA